MYKNGNFVIHQDKLHLIVKIEKTSIGNLYYLLDVSEDSNDEVKIVTSRNMEAYKARPRNTRPSSEMMMLYRHAILKIENDLNLEFNGQSLDDVNTFLRIFIQN